MRAKTAGCEKCGKTFESRRNLERHLARTRPCGPTLEVVEVKGGVHCCRDCGGLFSRSDSLTRHKKICPAAPRGGDGPEPRPPIVQNIQNVQNNITVFAPVTTNHVTTTILAVGAGAVASCAPAGWPPGWAAPLGRPAPFPSDFTIPLEVLRRALPSDVREMEACRRGEPMAIAALMVEIVRHMHADPKERNMYLNPKRADQVLVYIPERWQVRPLLEAVGLVFDHVAGEIAEALPLADPPLLRLAHAAREGFHAKRDEVVRRSCKAMSAHLADITALAQSGAGATWLGDAGDNKEARRSFGRESRAHLTKAALVDNLERSLEVYAAEDVRPEQLPFLARKALITYARLLLAGRATNLTVAALEGETACVWGGRRWEAGPAGSLAERQADAMLLSLAEWLGACEAPHFAALTAHLVENRGALAREEGGRRELLAQYARAAKNHHGEAWVREAFESCQAGRGAPALLVAAPPEKELRLLGAGGAPEGETAEGRFEAERRQLQLLEEHLAALLEGPGGA